MRTTVEHVCCQDVSVVVDKNFEAALDSPDGASSKPPTCVTEHPGFLAVFTNNGYCKLPVYIGTYSSTK